MFYANQKQAASEGLDLKTNRKPSTTLQCLPMTPETRDYYKGDKDNARKDAEGKLVDVFGEKPPVDFFGQKALAMLMARNYNISNKSLDIGGIYGNTGSALKPIKGIRARQDSDDAVAKWEKHEPRQVPAHEKTLLPEPVRLGMAYNDQQVLCSPDMELLYKRWCAEAGDDRVKVQAAYDKWYALRIADDSAAVKVELAKYERADNITTGKADDGKAGTGKTTDDKTDRSKVFVVDSGIGKKGGGKSANKQ